MSSPGHAPSRRRDGWSVDLARLEAAADDALYGCRLPANRDQGPEGKINSFTIRRGTGQLLGVLEVVLVNVD
jgi:hypothetical protein